VCVVCRSRLPPLFPPSLLTSPCAPCPTCPTPHPERARLQSAWRAAARRSSAPTRTRRPRARIATPPSARPGHLSMGARDQGRGGGPGLTSAARSPAAPPAAQTRMRRSAVYMGTTLVTDVHAGMSRSKLVSTSSGMGTSRVTDVYAYPRPHLCSICCIGKSRGVSISSGIWAQARAQAG
jgi:hypothetical protein